MRTLFTAVLLLVSALAHAQDDATKEAEKTDQQLIEGTWKITALTIDGNKARVEDLKNFRVINEEDGAWSLSSEGKTVSKGTSTLDSTTNPKTIDFTASEGEGQGESYRGIYELGENKRRLCFAPAGAERPKEFSSAPGSQFILVSFERVTDE